jgi:hypothetical protein
MDKRTTAAMAIHEINKIYCGACGDNSQKPWEEAEDWQRKAAYDLVDSVAQGEMTARQSHEAWLSAKEKDGWVYGEVKDGEKKMHPCMVPYDQLPEFQKCKDTIQEAAARGILSFDK